ncbi:phage major tail tube protein [Paenibacillus sp. GCM10027626]|uniref:phage major tail tube protein n=1 Tax=Paenibacillus sp. GCM10027626 TaxID=3273411 RepID=UPI003642DBC7
MRQIPDKLNNFTVFRNGSQWLGNSDIVLPNLEPKTDTLSGAGLGGEIESPTIGHFGSMTCTLNWRTVSREAIELLQDANTLDFRGAQQVYNPTNGQIDSVGIRVTVKAMAKNVTLGNFAPAAATETSTELEVTYIKIWQDGKVVVEIDKLNFVYRVNGKDLMEKIRKQLGM